MEARMRELAGRWLHKELGELTAAERRVLTHVIERRRISRHAGDAFQEQLTVGQRVADRVASFGGSWPFIFIFGGVLVAWIVTNSVILMRSHRAFDPYPYILLNLLLSMVAALQAPIIMMSQNRQAARDRLAADHDYEVNLKAEMEIMNLHEKVDELRERRWAELMRVQEEQIRILQDLLAGSGGDRPRSDRA